MQNIVMSTVETRSAGINKQETTTSIHCNIKNRSEHVTVTVRCRTHSYFRVISPHHIPVNIPTKQDAKKEPIHYYSSIFLIKQITSDLLPWTHPKSHCKIPWSHCDIRYLHLRVEIANENLSSSSLIRGHLRGELTGVFRGQQVITSRRIGPIHRLLLY